MLENAKQLIVDNINNSPIASKISSYVSCNDNQLERNAPEIAMDILSFDDISTLNYDKAELQFKVTVTSHKSREKDNIAILQLIRNAMHHQHFSDSEIEIIALNATEINSEWKDNSSIIISTIIITGTIKNL